MKLLNVLTDIKDKYIEEAAPKERKRQWKIIAGIAACLCIIASVTLFGFVNGNGHEKKGNNDSVSTGDKPNMNNDDITIIDPVQLIIYNNAYYENVDDKETRAAFGLPEKITADMAGEHIAYLTNDFEREVSMTPTDIELYSYTPVPCEAVMVMREADKYSVVIFCNHITRDGNIKLELSEWFEIFAVNSADDILSITKSTWAKKKDGISITDRGKIKDFYNFAVSLECYDNDGFQKEVFGGRLESEQGKIYTDMADSTEYLLIETQEGLKFQIIVYKNQGWMYSALTYYKMSEEITDWYDKNIK